MKLCIKHYNVGNDTILFDKNVILKLTNSDQIQTIDVWSYFKAECVYGNHQINGSSRQVFELYS